MRHQPRARQLGAVVDVAVAAVRDDGAALSAALAGALHADVVGFGEISPAAGRASLRAVSPDEARAAVPWSPAAEQVLFGHPLVRHYLARRTLAPLRTGDVVSRRAWRSCAAGVVLQELMGVEDQLAIPVATPDGGVRAWVAMRCSGTFTASERVLAVRLQPVLMAVAASARRPAAAVPAAGGCLDARLTEREAVVMRLLAEGLTATAIASRLAISPRTVTKHLEHLYRKLGVADRLSAVLVAQDAGLLLPPTSGPPHRGPLAH